MADLSELMAWAQGCPAVEEQIPSGSHQAGRWNCGPCLSIPRELGVYAYPKHIFRFTGGDLL